MKCLKASSPDEPRADRIVRAWKHQRLPGAHERPNGGFQDVGAERRSRRKQRNGNRRGTPPAISVLYIAAAGSNLPSCASPAADPSGERYSQRRTRER
jgi:hypothetical protein